MCWSVIEADSVAEKELHLVQGKLGQQDRELKVSGKSVLSGAGDSAGVSAERPLCEWQLQQSSARNAWGQEADPCLGGFAAMTVKPQT